VWSKTGTVGSSWFRLDSSRLGSTYSTESESTTLPILARVSTGAILTIGNELVSGDVENTNGAWLARRLEQLGVSVTLIASLPDEIDRIAAWVRAEAPLVDVLVVTGGLGGTPDDLTREAIAGAFGVEQEEIPELAAALRARFTRDPEYAARWARLPSGSRPLKNPLGGAPGFVHTNVYVLPGLPAEMQAMFETISGELRRGPAIASWRRRYRTTESRIAAVLSELARSRPDVLVGSYPRFDADGQEVEVVLKSRDREQLASAAAWLEPVLERATR
jgi:molybdenum cofactor synthesis domain-containing protein